MAGVLEWHFMGALVDCFVFVLYCIATGGRVGWVGLGWVGSG